MAPINPRSSSSTSASEQKSSPPNTSNLSVQDQGAVNQGDRTRHSEQLTQEPSSPQENGIDFSEFVLPPGRASRKVPQSVVSPGLADKHNEEIYRRHVMMLRYAHSQANYPSIETSGYVDPSDYYHSPSVRLIRSSSLNGHTTTIAVTRIAANQQAAHHVENDNNVVGGNGNFFSGTLFKMRQIITRNTELALMIFVCMICETACFMAARISDKVLHSLPLTLACAFLGFAYFITAIFLAYQY